jgi:hypothetical protein
MAVEAIHTYSNHAWYGVIKNTIHTQYTVGKW